MSVDREPWTVKEIDLTVNGPRSTVHAHSLPLHLVEFRTHFHDVKRVMLGIVGQP